MGWWVFGLRLRLRRQGMQVRFVFGPNLRMAGKPHLDVDVVEGRGGGTLTIAIGAHVRIGRDTVFDVRPGSDNTVEIGEGTVLEDHVRFQLRGGAVRLADHASVRDGCQFKSSGELLVGSRVVVGRGSALHCAERIELGDHVGLAERVSIIDSDHVADGSSTWFLDQPLEVAPVVLEDNVWVGANVAILRGALVRANAVVAAGSVVGAGEHPGGWLIGGAPARPLKSLSE